MFGAAAFCGLKTNATNDDDCRSLVYSLIHGYVADNDGATSRQTKIELNFERDVIEHLHAYIVRLAA